MTDGQWALLAPLPPTAGSTGGRGGRPEVWSRRLVLDAIFYLVRGLDPRGRGAGSTQRCVNVRVWPTGVAQYRPRP